MLAQAWIDLVKRYRLRRILFISRLTDLLIFYRVHGRLPRRDSFLINDIKFWIKAGRDAIALAPFTDKELAKHFVAGMVGPDKVPKTFAVLTSEAALRAYHNDAPYVAKPTHTSGGVVVKAQGGPLSKAEADQLSASLASDYYLLHGEHFYRKLAPKIIIEEFLSRGGEAAPDYKFTFYRGKCLYVNVHVTRFTNHRSAFFTPDWRRIERLWDSPAYDGDIPRPDRLDEMLAIAHKIAACFKLCRVDFYVVGDRFYVGEITFAQGNALRKFLRPETEDVRYFLPQESRAPGAARLDAAASAR